VVVVLELGPLDDEKAHAAEDGLDALAQEREGMPMARGRHAAGQRDVHSSLDGPSFSGGGQAVVDRGFDLLFQRVDELAEARALVGGALPSARRSAETSPPLRAR
jgi:hypothetical protein